MITQAPLFAGKEPIGFGWFNFYQYGKSLHHTGRMPYCRAPVSRAHSVIRPAYRIKVIPKVMP